MMRLRPTATISESHSKEKQLAVFKVTVDFQPPRMTEVIVVRADNIESVETTLRDNSNLFDMDGKITEIIEDNELEKHLPQPEIEVIH